MAKQRKLANLRRSLRYLWPYRRRLALAMVCIFFVAALWGGGIGMVGPMFRVLMNEEGLHGWAYSRVSNESLGGKFALLVSPGNSANDQAPIVLNVTDIEEDGPAELAGLAKGEWIVGLVSDDPNNRVMRGDDLLRLIAHSQPGRQLTLRVINPITREPKQAIVTLDQPKWSSAALNRVISYIPEATTGFERFTIFLYIIFVSLAMTLLRDLFRFFQEYLVETTVYRGIMDLRCDTYDVALRLPMTFYSSHGSTDSMSRLVQDIHRLARAQVTLLGKTLAEPAKAVATLILAFLCSWEITLLALLAGPLVFFMVRKLGKRMRRATKKALEGSAVLLGVLEETLTGIRVVKAYTMEGQERKRLFQANRRVFKQRVKIAKIDAAIGPAVEALGMTAATLAAAIGGYWVFTGRIEPENFMATMAALAAMFDPVRKLSKVLARFQRAEAAGERLFELMDREQEKVVHGAPMLERHSKSLAFENVNFRYPNAPDDTLKNINLEITAGQTVAVVGPNGCGKTTLVSLLPRLLDPDSGKVLIDGQDVSQYSLRSLRRQIGIVTQDAVLFHATIGENIAYGLRRPKQEQILDAAKKAFVDEFVRDLPDGYDTMVGEHGSTLSGGQKQRISIARAILRDPAILIFDEATSQIDSDSERRIHDAMEEFIKDRTTLMIAHRFATVLQADKIVVMNAGQIEDVGTHAELLDRCALYKHLYNTQLGDAQRDS